MLTQQDMDSTFHALSHAIRRDILDILRAKPGLTVGKLAYSFLAYSFDVTRIAVMNHLKVLTGRKFNHE